MATNVLVYLREEAQKAALLEIAARDGYINKKGEPSISAMVQAIANGEVVVSTPCNWKIHPDADGYRLTDCGECVVRYGDHGAYCQHCGGVRVEVGTGDAN